MSARTYHHGQLRSAIIGRASELLEAHGPQGVSLRGIARDLGVSHAAPAHHFESHEGLLQELAADGYADLSDALEGAMESTLPTNWEVATGRAYVRFGLANPERYRLMFTSRITSGDCPIRLMEQSTRAYLALLASVRQQPATGDPANYEVAWPELRAWSLVHGAVMLRLDGQMAGLTEDRFLELIDELLTR